jgi:hypothetical protein
MKEKENIVSRYLIIEIEVWHDHTRAAVFDSRSIEYHYNEELNSLSCKHILFLPSNMAAAT